ncbi:MAG: hypothetical protein Q7J27_03345 [Syntrophales bacterium]|nr:hypothetical protein [Syntrophales bacterium]
MKSIMKKGDYITVENCVRIVNQNPQKSEAMEATIINAISIFFKVNPGKQLDAEKSAIYGAFMKYFNIF